MTTGDDASRLETLSKLAQSRADIRRILDPPPRAARASSQGEGGELPGHGEGSDPRGGVFPRSHTMRLLMSGRGIGTVGAVVGGLLMARPRLAFKLVRMLPTGAIARILMLKAVTAFRSRH